MKIMLGMMAIISIALLCGCYVEPKDKNININPPSNGEHSSQAIVHPTQISIGKIITKKVILVYISAANNLQSFAIDNIKQIPPYIDPSNAVFLFYLDVKGYDTAYTPDWMKQFGGGLFMRNFQRDYIGIPELDYYDRIYTPADVDSCNPQTLRDVLHYIKTNIVCEPRGLSLIIWSHGNGMFPMGTNFTLTDSVLPYQGVMRTRISQQSVGLNEGSGKSLSDSAICWAISNTFGTVASGGGLANIGFDTCWMGNIENAYEYVGYVHDYIIGSPTVEPSTGWNYTIMYLLTNNVGTFIDLNKNSGVNLVGYIPATLTNSLNIMENFYQYVSFNNTFIKYYIERTKILVTSSVDPNLHYLKIYNLMYDFSTNFGGNFTTLFNQYEMSLYNPSYSFYTKNAFLWVPVYPKQYYSEYYKIWHSAAALKLFRDHPILADCLTNGIFGQTQNSTHLYVNISNLWSKVGNLIATNAVNVTGSYVAYYLDMQGTDQTINTAYPLTPAVMGRTNVAYIAGEGQVDIYKINVQTAGYIRVRISVKGASTCISNAQLVDASGVAIQTYNVSDFNTNTGPTGLALDYSAGGSIDINSTEWSGLSFVEFYQNLSAGVYYLKVAAPEFVANPWGPTDRPYLLYPLALTNGETKAVLQ